MRWLYFKQRGNAKVCLLGSLLIFQLGDFGAGYVRVWIVTPHQVLGHHSNHAIVDYEYVDGYRRHVCLPDSV